MMEENNPMPIQPPMSQPMPRPMPDASLGTSQPPSTPSTGTGYLIVAVTTARGAIPLEGAAVEIRSYEREGDSDSATRGDVLYSLSTGRDGRTERVALPAPDRQMSEQPTQPGGVPPYALYQVDVVLEGYSRQSYLAVPIFDGITAIQPAVLIPLPENGTAGIPRPDEQRFFELGGGTLG